MDNINSLIFNNFTVEYTINGDIKYTININNINNMPNNDNINIVNSVNINNSNINNKDRKYKYKKCIHEGCTKYSNFNYINNKKPLYCNEHKKEGMINVKSKKCIHEGCNKRSSFNYSNRKKGLYCASHKLEDMVNIQYNKRKLAELNEEPNKKTKID